MFREAAMPAQMDQRTTSMRITVEAVEAAKIAAAYKGLSMMDYVAGIVLEAANRDIEEGHRTRSAPAKRRKGGE